MRIEMSCGSVGRSYRYGTGYFLCGCHDQRAFARSDPACPARRPQLTCNRTGTESRRYLSDRELAGSLGVKITEAIVGQGLLREVGGDYQLTKKGAQWFSDLGIDIDALRKSGRVFARQCLDWSERRNHLAGALGSALSEHLFERGWIEHVRESRAVRITELGRRELKRRLGVACDN